MCIIVLLLIKNIFMKLILIISALVILTLFIMWCIIRIIKCMHNLIVLKKYGKAIDGVHHVEGSGIVVNKKTQKLEGTSSKVILPFD